MGWDPSSKDKFMRPELVPLAVEALNTIAGAMTKFRALKQSLKDPSDQEDKFRDLDAHAELTRAKMERLTRKIREAGDRHSSGKAWAQIIYNRCENLFHHIELLGQLSKVSMRFGDDDSLKQRSRVKGECKILRAKAQKLAGKRQPTSDQVKQIRAQWQTLSAKAKDAPIWFEDWLAEDELTGEIRVKSFYDSFNRMKVGVRERVTSNWMERRVLRKCTWL